MDKIEKAGSDRGSLSCLETAVKMCIGEGHPAFGICHNKVIGPPVI